MDVLQNSVELEEAASLTLEEALELIDNCDGVPSLDVLECGPLDIAAGSGSDASSQSALKSKKRVRNPQNDVRRRQRRKAERQQLKDQVQQYEALVVRLKRNGVATETRALTQQSSKSPWLHVVVEEEQKRHKAEELNAKLRTLLVERLQTAGVIRDALVKERTLLAKIDSNAELNLQVPSDRRQLRLTPDDISSQLRMTVRGIFDDTDAVFRSFPANSFDSLECISRVKQQDETSGPCIELLTTTPLPCDFKTAKHVLWEVVADKEWPSKQTAFSLKTKESSLQSLELRFSMEFENLDQTQIMLDGATLLQRRDEEHRTVLAWTSVVGHETERLHFRSQGWIVISRSPTDLHGASFVRTLCRIAVDDTNVSTMTSTERNCDHKNMLRNKLRNAILRSMGRRVKDRVEEVQQSLVSRTGTLGGGDLIFI
ncbi:hypothetical protein PRIC1_012682 [Phytophthora ramorum]